MTIRVIVPFTDVHPLADRALREVVPEAERVDVGGNNLAYSRLLAELWADGESFLIIEHDNEITAAALQEAISCDCPWGVNPYNGAGRSWEHSALIDKGLGCTRFSAILLANVPDAAMKANAINDGGSVCPPGHWKRLDARLYGVLRDAGYRQHLHSRILHHHWYQYGCACGKDHE